jgi:acetoin utilization deacetylase AcuC-like enzyme
MSMIVVATERFAEHQTPPGHPESPERATVMDAVADEWRHAGGDLVAPGPATNDQLARVHDEAYLERIADTAGRAAKLDPDTYTSPESVEIAHLAAGAAIDAVGLVVGGSHRRGLALVRPPGHHAEADRAMGFCLYNNVAVAVAHAKTLGVSKVAVLDYDVHHGNGTQHMFESDPDVLYVSVHQSRFYPGTGEVGEVGRGAGAGFTVNLPLEVGAVDEDYRVVFSEVVVPVVRQFQPDLVVVSAGFDAHERDPIAGMRVTTSGFAAMTMDVLNVAEECCAGRLVAVTEGGYDLRAFGDCLRQVVRVLSSHGAGTAEWPAAGAIAPTRGQAAARAAQAALGRFWSL